ncbi:hydroxymethylglutaryl-CoA reductase [Capsaspora owczarzaki ATCC 30864]|uniref:3-hydroxy-3-methylglutaryl coenzyme A reductase n=1 Tax=Capsaspora owczarzaki (strain ATCC 30864) TaxID=595528 RepID=A0A0D2U0X8_CAPO3|nr:hydroxymethylglutaryl-CoA reductase [Capsaspora owczarzaki ATCC 30864]KJE88891.1 hydroxymethylglutaryl-CoA reductase [Capsaspora owczarzaki ATCC 30864]|eukprot:XP_004365336.2 hydroxymethylglutaryl-CoA reductase [Capsaspora owczarzaki ATCC 30864]
MTKAHLPSALAADVTLGRPTESPTLVAAAAAAAAPMDATLPVTAALKPLTATTTTTTTTQQPAAHPALWTGFYKKTVDERRDLLALAFPRVPQPAFDGLDETAADNMVENCIGTIGLPVGLGVNFVMNGQPFVVPMAVEEPSVIAAVSGVAKLLAAHGEPKGFVATHSERNIVVGQVQLLDIPDMAAAEQAIALEKEQLIELGNMFCKNMVTRGGGVCNVTFRRVYLTPRRRNGNAVAVSVVPVCLVVEMHVDVCDSMGANCVTGVAEGVAPTLARLTNGRVGVRILSNLTMDRIATASFRIPTRAMAYKGYSGEKVVQSMLELYQWADNDPTRACTNNKGVMNGIDAVALATGQDFRALEAAAHAYVVAQHGRYAPFTEYWLEDDGATFCGQLSLPMPVGVFGGPLRTNAAYQNALLLLGNPSAKTLAMILVSVGLCQNFAAMRALSTEGIRRGHMALHARNIAIAAGAPSHAVQEVVAFMIATDRITVVAASEYLKAHAIHAELFRSEKERLQLLYQHQLAMPGLLLPHADSSAVETAVNATGNLPSGNDAVVAPSTFLYEEAFSSTVPTADGAPGSARMTFNVAFETLGDTPEYVVFDQDRENPLTLALFGRRGHSWLSAVMRSLDTLRLPSPGPPRANLHVVKRLKTLSILMNILTRQLMIINSDATRQVLGLVLGSKRKHRLPTHANAEVPASTTLLAPRSVDPAAGVHSGISKESRPTLSLQLAGASSEPAETRALLQTNPRPALSSPSFVSSPATFAHPNSDHPLEHDGATESERERSLHLDTVREIVKLRSHELRVGLPLLLSLWHVFEYRVEQAAGPARDFARLILDEQSRVLSSLIANPAATTVGGDFCAAQSESGPLSERLLAENKREYDIEALTDFLGTHAKRFHVTLFLLCDALADHESRWSPPRLARLCRVGRYLEWQGAIVHDIARHDRDRHDGTPNALLYWLQLPTRDRASASGTVTDDLVSEFVRVALLTCAEQTADLFDQEEDSDVNDSSENPVFTQSSVREALNNIRTHYGKAELFAREQQHLREERAASS